VRNGETGVLIHAVGDVMLGDGHYHVGEGVASTVNREGPDFLFERVREFLSRANLCLGNLEVPLASESEAMGPKRHMFRGDPECAPALRRAGFGALSLANNHMFDHGESALLETGRHLRDAGILPLGLRSGDRRFQSAPEIVDTGGLRFVLLGHWVTERPGRGVAAVSTEAILEDVLAAQREFHPDWTVISVHWGNEYMVSPSPAQLDLARRISSAAERVILLGHHPHVVQGVETRGKNLFAYSLGNFVFDANFCPDVMRGAILSLLVNREGLLRYRLIPIRISALHRPEIAEGDRDMMRRIESAIQDVGRYRDVSGEEYAKRARREMLRKRLRMWMSLLRRHTNLPRRTARYVVMRKLKVR
jgi:poly-gamma-glutamate synthesis protein (capsule biosynthesis protein)